MPFVRVSRDKRGYEQISLVHVTVRRGRPSKSRVLYVFRTPPGIKIGREPFDEAIQRELEAQHPGIVFDWKTLSNIPVPAPDVEYWRERRKVDKAAKLARRAEEQVDAAEELESSEQARLDAPLDFAVMAEDGPAAATPVAAAAGEPVDERLDIVAPANAAGEEPLPGQHRRQRRGGRRRHRGSRLESVAAPIDQESREVGAPPQVTSSAERAVEDPFVPEESEDPSKLA